MKRKITFVIIIFLLVINCTRNNDPLEKAKAFIDIKRFENAVEQAEFAIQEDPRNVEAHIIKGKAFLLAGEFNDAKNSFDTAILLKTESRKKIAQIYLDAGLNFYEENFRRAKQMFTFATEINPDLDKEISKLFIDEAFEKIELSPDITNEMLNILDLAIEFTRPKDVENQKEFIATKLWDEAIKRKDKGFIKSSAILGSHAYDLNPFIQKKYISLLLALGYTAFDNDQSDIGKELLEAVLRMDDSYKTDSKYFVYLNFKGITDPSKLNLKIAENFLIEHNESPYCEDVLFQIIQYYNYTLDVEKTKFYIAKTKVDYPDGKYKNEITKIENNLNALE